MLFFVLADLGNIDSMYQFALDAYILLFQNSIKKSAEKVRVDNVADLPTLFGKALDPDFIPSEHKGKFTVMLVLVPLVQTHKAFTSEGVTV